MPNQLDLPPVYMAIAIMTVIILSWIGNAIGAVLGAWFWGALLMVAGIGLIGWSVYLFREYQTTIIPRQTADALVMDGPFLISRNPMYLGMVLITLGLGMILGPLIAYVPAFVLAVFLDRNFIAKEEEKLKAQFGTEAELYIRDTAKWIGVGPVMI